MAVHIDKSACLRYLIERQTPAGGFCYYRAYGVEEANGLDTYSAIAALQTLQADIPRRGDLVNWLQHVQNRRGGFPNLTMAWYALTSLRLLSAQPRRDPDAYLHGALRRLQAATKTPALNNASALQNWLRLIELQINRQTLPTELRDGAESLVHNLRGSHGGYGKPGENLLDSYQAALIMHRLQRQLPPSLLGFAESCLDPAYGFRLTPTGSSNSLATLQAGISLLRLFDAQPTPTTAVRIQRYIASCQTDSGGFGRTPGAIPTLADTHRALATLQQLPARHA